LEIERVFLPQGKLGGIVRITRAPGSAKISDRTSRGHGDEDREADDGG
jgi:hypothetical protein